MTARPEAEACAAHTPGPWKFDRDWRRVPAIIGADGVFCNPFADAVHDPIAQCNYVADRLDQERRR